MDDKYNEAAIIPLSTYYAIVLSIREQDNKKENCVIGYVSKDNQTIVPNAQSGELKLQYYDTSITLMSDGIVLTGDNIFVNDKPWSVAVTDGVSEQSYSHDEIADLEARIKSLEEQINNDE